MSSRRRSGFFYQQVCCTDCTGFVGMAKMGQDGQYGNEVGFSICRDPSGGLSYGPAAEGGPYSVEIPVECPPGGDLIGLYHTHPGGTTRPSQTDIRSAKAFGVKALCIEVPDTGAFDCYDIGGRGGL